MPTPVRTASALAALAACAAFTACATPGPDEAGAGGEPGPPPVLNVRTAHGAASEEATRERLLALADRYDLSPWIVTTEIVIDRTRIPHSHPVLTLHTRHLGDDDRLLTTFVHEQLHWWVQEHGDLQAARHAFSQRWPDPPPPDEGGASDARSTWLHLVVCDLELQGLTALLGEARAREVLAGQTHYEWIYDKVLNDPEVRRINARYGMTHP